MALTKVRGSGLGTLGDGTANDVKILFDGNAQDYHVGLDDSADSLIIGKGSALGTTSHIVTDANGHVTMPLQPCFSIGLSGGNHNTNDANIVFNSEAFDIGDNYNNSTGVFTAPVAGRYYFSANIMTNNNNAVGYLYWSYYHNSSYVAHCYQYQDTANAHQMFQMPLLLNMAASDTLSVRSRAGTWYGSATQHGRFEGYLIA